MRNFAEYKHYFRSLALAHYGIKDFIFGDSVRILNEERSELSYPVLWLESPDITINEGMIRFAGSFVILRNVEVDNFAEQDIIMAELEHIAQSLLFRMKSDSNEGLFEVQGGLRLDPIATLTADNDYGWRATFIIEHDEYDCFEECFDPRLDPGAIVAFEWENIDEDDFEVALSNISLPEGEWDLFEWEWQFEDDAPQTATGESIPNIIPGEAGKKNLKITLTATKTGAMSGTATAFILPGSGCGVSTPGPIVLL